MDQWGGRRRAREARPRRRGTRGAGGEAVECVRHGRGAAPDTAGARAARARRARRARGAPGAARGARGAAADVANLVRWLLVSFHLFLPLHLFFFASAPASSHADCRHRAPPVRVVHSLNCSAVRRINDQSERVKELRFVDCYFSVLIE
ncbi:hypothetical protein GUJ93_ZPchr0004g38890 [Zizania palustris]|uniref:Uncharacterized protein n=1 Tax=Zizania palustris TaxID=103762 RepID=A0A8J5VZQ3_ZIZPA|nr:hypothetical protein GUJ93_ZPchr0004g38890 [Zizania palustris]